MASVICSISGIKFIVEHMPLRLSAKSGYVHPIFAANRTQLLSVYEDHTKGLLTTTESYLLFLALCNESNLVDWEYTIEVDHNQPHIIKLIENNMAQVLTAITKTEAIKAPNFYQPRYKVSETNNNLLSLSNWVAALIRNVDEYFILRADEEQQLALEKAEKKLTNRILSGDHTSKYVTELADWADRAAAFPVDKREEYKKVIRNCYNQVKMKGTPLALIKEVQEYCYCNIEVGSIHFHSLHGALREGINRHVDYLGLGMYQLTGEKTAKDNQLMNLLSDVIRPMPASLEGNTNIVSERLLTPEPTVIDSYNKEQSALADMKRKAPKVAPVKENYATLGEYMKALLAYKALNS